MPWPRQLDGQNFERADKIYLAGEEEYECNSRSCVQVKPSSHVDRERRTSSSNRNPVMEIVRRFSKEGLGLSAETKSTFQDDIYTIHTISWMTGDSKSVSVP